jgi:hypothetical protein
MEVKVLRKTVGIFSGRGLFKRKIEDFLNLLGGIHVEHINKRSFEMTKDKKEKNYLKKFFNDIKDNSKIFYNKYLRSTSYYDHLEMDKIKRGTLEAVMMDFIRRQ